MLLFIRKFLTQNTTKTVLYILCFIGLYFAFTEFGFANDDEPSGLVWGVDKAIQLVASLLWAITAFISLLLYPGWTNGTIFGLDVYMKEIWILISNIVYFMFAFILIIIAFMNIIWKWDGTWELKQAMPKFIVWVLMVPFSWFFIQFILSISAILTVGVLTLPFDAFQDKDFFEWMDGTTICTKVEVFLWATDWSDWAPGGEALLWESIRCHEDKPIWEFFNGTDEEPGVKNSIFGVISVYTYGVLGLDSLDELTGGDIPSIGDLMDLSLKVIFDLLFIVVYLLLMLALFMALFTRGVWLWIYTMLSPVFGLLYFFWKAADWVGEGKKFSAKEFIALALVPVYVSAALAFGLVFLFVASNWLATTEGWLNEDGSIDAGWINFLISWVQWDSTNDEGFFSGGGSALGKLVVEIFGIVILWIAVISALGASKTTEAIVKPIADFWKSVWELAAKAPTYAPIIPTWNGMMSTTALASAWSQVKNAIAWEQTSKGNEMWSSFAKNILNTWENDASRITNAMSEHQAALESGTASTAELWRALNTLLKSSGTALATSSSAKNAFHEQMSQLFWDDYSTAMRGKVNSATNEETLGRELQAIFRELNRHWNNGQIINQTFGTNAPEASDILSVINWGTTTTEETRRIEVSFDRSWLVDARWKVIGDGDDRTANIEAIASQVVANNRQWVLTEQQFRDGIDNQIHADSEAIDAIVERLWDEFFSQDTSE